MSYKPFTTDYTLQIIDDIKKYLKETNKDQTTLDTLDLCHLIGEIERLNKRVKECEEAYLRTRHQYSELESKYVIDEYIINELEKYLNEDDWTSVNGVIATRLIKNRLRELKGDSSNE